jgi:hypothetical protein
MRINGSKRLIWTKPESSTASSEVLVQELTLDFITSHCADAHVASLRMQQTDPHYETKIQQVAVNFVKTLAWKRGQVRKTTLSEPFKQRSHSWEPDSRSAGK